MEIVDGVAPVILCVPTEAWETHANVTPRDLHTRYVCIDVAHNWLI